MTIRRVESEEAPEPEQTSWKGRARIALVIRLLNGRVGGAERLFCETANMFAGAGYDVTVLHCDSSSEPIKYPLSAKVARINLWGKAARSAPWYGALDALARAYPKRKAMAPVDWVARNLYFARRLHAATRAANADLIISFMPPANTASLLAGRLAGVPVIPTNHSVPVHDYRSDVRWDQNPIDKQLRFWSLYSAARVHVLFPGFAAWFPPAIQKKIVPIPNFVSAEFAGAVATAPRKQEILGVGRFSTIKNYGALVEAWALIAHKHPGWKVKLYGGGPLRGQLAHRVSELGLDGSVEILGHDGNIKQRYLEAEVLCHPGLFEGFGLSVAEALACGLPVVAFADCEGVNQFVKDGDNGALADRAGGPAALAAALERVIGDDALRDRLRQRAPDSVADFNLDAFRARWVAVVDAVLAERGAR